jgi:hypothetical protein
MQNAAYLRLVEGLRQQIVGAQIERFSPEAGVRQRIGYDDFRFVRGFTSQMQRIQPVSVG